MPRPVYLIVFPSPLFAAHWGLWIPSMGELDVGKYLHATGDAANGFQVAFKRNYDLSTSGRSYQLLELAQVLDDYIVDVKGDGSESEDQTAHDYLEEVALSIPAPDRSLVPATTPVSRSSSSCTNSVHIMP
jgi:hypothetical protein